MKTNFIAILMMAFATVSIASDMPTVSNDKSKTLTIAASSLKGGTIDITIFDAQNNTIHAETIKNEKVARSYDVRNLPNGKYVIEMSNGLKTTKQNFEIYSSEVFLDKNVETFYAPVVNVSENFVDVNAVGPKAIITFVDQDNNLLKSETVTSSTIHRRFNVAKLPAGIYTVSVNTKEKSTSKTFEKK